MILLNLAIKIAASILSVPPESISVSLPPMAPPPRSAQEFQRRREIDAALASFWKKSDGFDSPSEEQDFVDERYGAESKRPSTYGEVTSLGSRQLFDYMNMYQPAFDLSCGSKKQDIIFYDLGSGAGRLVAQSFLELPRIHKAVGVELAASRHESATSAWEKLVDSGRADEIRRMGAGNTTGNSDRASKECVNFVGGDLFDLDVSDATHIYASSLCFTGEMMVHLANKLNSEAPNLQCVATLQPFPTKSLFGLKHPAMEFVEMSWTAARGEGCPVYFYFRPTFTCNNMEP